MRRIIVITTVLSAALATGAFNATASVRAQSFAPQPTPVYREVIILRVHVLDDMDDLTWGELTYRFRLMRRTATCEGYSCPGSGNEFRASMSESAPTGAVLNTHKVLGPIAMFPGEQMLVGVAGVEEDWDVTPPFCPPVPLTRFDDSLCGAHDPLGVQHSVFSGPNWGIGTHSMHVHKGFNATYRVDFEVRQAGTATTPIMGGGGSSTPTPSPTPIPTARPGFPPRHEP
jgi:hypothetical protein